MKENPVSYVEGYRLRVIRSMSPVKRTSKVDINLLLHFSTCDLISKMFQT